MKGGEKRWGILLFFCFQEQVVMLARAVHPAKEVEGSDLIFFFFFFYEHQLFNLLTYSEVILQRMQIYSY